MTKVNYAPIPSLSTKKSSHSLSQSPFYIIYNHRRILRAKALKKMKQEKRKEQIQYLIKKKLAEKQQKLKNWNFSMLDQDSAWQNVYGSIKKEEKQSDLTTIKMAPFQQKFDKVRLNILYNFPSVNKKSLFLNNFSPFMTQMTSLGCENVEF